MVRVSGRGAEGIARRLVRPWPVAAESHRLYLGRVFDPDSDELLDEVLGALMRAPRTFTGEDVLELSGHGGEANLGRLVEAVVRAGARLAEPGEFTRRAFLAGRIDLTQAEAVAEVIAARSERALRQAQAQRGGALGAAVTGLRARLVELLADVEGRVDFPDEELDFAPSAQVAAEAAALAGEVASLGRSYVRGRIIAGGIDVALVGRPNAGKSSLLNALVGEERALVDASPGTTRDFVEAEVEIDGLRVRLVDTAGERDDGGAVEQRGRELGRRRRARADVWVVVVDGEVGFGAVEARLAAAAGEAAVVVAWNKADRAPVARVDDGVAVVATSATRGDGLTELRAAIRRAVGDLGEEGAVAVSSARQREALEAAAAALAAGGEALGAGEPPELAAVELRVALERLGRVLGAGVGDEVLDAIFRRFCIGK